jgi:hypothetical protein
MPGMKKGNPLFKKIFFNRWMGYYFYFFVLNIGTIESRQRIAPAPGVGGERPKGY